MAFLNPNLLLLGLLAIPLVLLYMLRLRRRDVPVSSTMLWQQLVQDRQANAPWQRLRRNLFLLLQLLLLALLVLALARPFFRSETLAGGNVVVLLDGSASMLANDVDPNRFEAATRRVEALIAEMDSDDQMTIILVGRTPTVLASASRDPRQLRRALEAGQAQAATADWAAALALAAGAVQGFEAGRIILLSDGGLPNNLPALPAPVVYVPIGQEADNLAVTALATRETVAGPQAFASVSNYGPLEQQALASLRVNGRLIDSRHIELARGQSEALLWSLPSDARELQVTLEPSGPDHLAQDNMAWAVRSASGQGRTLLLGEGNRFLETVLQVMPDVELVRAAAAPDADAEDFALIVYDGVPLPAQLPPSDALVIDPLPAAEDDGPLSVGAAFTQTAVVRVADHDLLRFVDWNRVNVRQARQVQAPWARTLVSAAGGPLLLAGEWQGRRMIVLTFRLQESDLPLQIAFPVLMANIVNWLRPGRVVSADESMTVGESVPLRSAGDAVQLIIRGPGELVWTRTPEEGVVEFTETERPGLYEVIARDGDGDEQAVGAFAVNLFAPDESAIEVVEDVRLGQERLSDPRSDGIARNEVWRWLAAAALVLLVLEWWGYHTGWRLPSGLTRRLQRADR